MYVMLTPCVFQGGNMMVLKRALLMWYEGHVLPYFWLKCCIVLFCLQAQTEDYQMCQCLFLSFVAQFLFILWVKELFVEISHCTKAFEGDQMSGTGFVRLKVSWNAGL